MLLCLKVLEPRFAGLVEMFLVEVYRCKLCQFTSKIRMHLAYMYEIDTACQIAVCPKMGHD